MQLIDFWDLEIIEINSEMEVLKSKTRFQLCYQTQSHSKVRVT